MYLDSKGKLLNDLIISKTGGNITTSWGILQRAYTHTEKYITKIIKDDFKVTGNLINDIDVLLKNIESNFDVVVQYSITKKNNKPHILCFGPIKP